MVNTRDKQLITEIVKTHLPDKSYKAFIFGSRASNDNRPFSDVDLGIYGDNPLPSKNFIELKEALENSDLPFRADVVDFSLVTEEFKQNALANVIEL